MKSKTLMCITAIALFAALAIPLRLAAQDAQVQNQPKHTRYTVTDVGTLGGTSSEAVGISNRGSVSGDSNPLGNSVTHGFFWEKGVITDLGTLGGPNSIVPEEWPPNNRGEVEGFSDTSNPDPNGEDFCGFGTGLICLPFIWQKGVMTALPTLGGSNAQALAINNGARWSDKRRAPTQIPAPLSP